MTKHDETTASKGQVEEKAKGTALEVIDYGADVGGGMEDVTQDEYSIPFLRILDSKSPQCKPKSAGGLGLKPGSIINMATGEDFDGEAGVDFIPVHRDHNFVQWIKKNEDGSGGGFVGIVKPDDAIIATLQKEHGKFGKLPVPNTNPPEELVETYSLYGILLVNDSATPCVVAFSSTQIKKYRNFMSRIMGITYQGPNGPVRPPMWAHIWHLKSTYESKGTFNWFGWVIGLKSEPPITSRLKLNDPLYVGAREFYESIKSGRVVVDHSKDSPPSTETDDEIPM